MFPLDGKIKLSVAGVSKYGRKKWFPLARESVSTSRNQVIFQKLDFPEKNLQIKEYCFKYVEIRFPLAGVENLFKTKFLPDKNLLTLGEISEKSKKTVANSSDTIFK